MNDLEYRLAVKIAEENCDRLKQLPDSIREREEALFGKISNSPHSRLKKLELLFSEMDVLYGYAHKFAICKKGCNSCCHSAIDISELEAEYIHEKAKPTKLKREELDNACPFLKDGICSIYDYRPFLCRRHLSVTDSAKWCELDIILGYKIPIFNFPEVDKSYAHLLGPAGGKTVKDIRLAFT